MNAPLVAFTHTLAIVGFVLLWLAVGAVVGALLAEQGHPTGSIAVAAFAWPLMAPLLTSDRARKRGPMAARIDHAIDRLKDSLADQRFHSPVDLDSARASLHRIDARLARVDRMLAEGDLPAADVATLQRARSDAEAGIIAVIEEMGRLRVRAGLAALAADAGPMEGRLAELTARVSALDEVSAAGR